MFLPVIGAVVGTSLGIMQWLALRSGFQVAGWALASAIGVGVGLTLGTTMIEFLGLTKGNIIDELVGLTVIGTAFGVSLGVMQWLVLRRVGPGTAWWIPANAIGMGVGFLVGGLMAAALVGSFRNAGGLIMIVVFSGLAVGALTGFILPRLIPPQVQVRET